MIADSALRDAKKNLTEILKTELSKSDNKKFTKDFLSEFDRAFEILTKIQIMESPRNISLDNQLSNARDRVGDLDAQRKEINKEIITLLVAAEHILFLQYFKSSEISKNFLILLSNKQFLSATLLIRALHELTAMACFLAEEMNKRISRIEKQLEATKIIKEVELTRKFLEKFYYGSSSPESDVKNFDIGKGRTELKKFLPREHIIYNLLCDYVHPNYKSNDIFGDGNLLETTLAGNDIKKLTLSIQLIYFFGNYIEILINNIAAYGAKLSFFKDSIPKIEDGNIKISNIFRATKIKNTNDGKSIDTAVDLTNSKSAGDQVRMQVEWLAKNNFSNQGRQIVKVEKNYAYDVVKTNKGKRYFKLKIHQIL